MRQKRKIRKFSLDYSTIAGEGGSMTKREEIKELQKLRGLIIGVMSGSVDASAIESYSHGEADGSQSVKRRDPNSLMRWLDDVDNKIAALERSLRGGGLMTFSTNRYAR
jgi:hypothetical protein